MQGEKIINKIEEAVPALLKLAIDMSWNKISTNCKFIVSEIKNSDKNFREELKIRIKENERKSLQSLETIKGILGKLYENIYDINLYIYRSTNELTIIDIRYYLKSSLDESYRLLVENNEPMLHCKVSLPPWRINNEKFDINWEHNSDGDK